MPGLLNAFDIQTILVLIPATVVLVHVVNYLVDPHKIAKYPGPLLAKFSEVWLGRVAAEGHRSEVVHELHKQYGTFVRLAPNHLSINSPDALQVVYAHGNGSLKSNFYDAFVSIQRGLFNTRSRPEHARKRKIVSHIFSQKAVLDFEPHVRLYVGQLIRQWERLCDQSQKQGAKGDEGEGGWVRRDGRLWLDCLPWYNYLAFDIIGDLAFGAPFGMLQTCKDAAPVALSQEKAIASYGKDIEITMVPAVKTINDRGMFSASLGVLAPWMRPIAKKHPWFQRGQAAVKALAGIAVAAVAKRLQNPDIDRVDLLGKLLESKDDEGNPMGREELTAEALTQLIAGSDTTSNSSCAVTYHLAKNPEVQRKLQAELDAALGHEDDYVTNFNAVKRLPYLQAVIDETLRIHATSGIGLPRIVPEGGLTVCGEFFPEGTVLSVPTYSIHRDKSVWGEDVDAFRPERWLDGDAEKEKERQKAFNPFSFGPRSCVGRNLADMEMLIIIASILRRFDFVLEYPEKPLETMEGFLRKPVECHVGIKKRDT